MLYGFFVLCRSVYCLCVCTVLLPPGGYPTAVKYIILYSACVFETLVIHHAMRVRRTTFSSVARPAPPYFPT